MTGSLIWGGVDAIYFDNRHMPDICTCRHCLDRFRRESGHEMNHKVPIGWPDYLEAVRFANPSMWRPSLSVVRR